jgi:hypothetical protein
VVNEKISGVTFVKFARAAGRVSRSSVKEPAVMTAAEILFRKQSSG